MPLIAIKPLIRDEPTRAIVREHFRKLLTQAQAAKVRGKTSLDLELAQCRIDTLLDCFLPLVGGAE